VLLLFAGFAFGRPFSSELGARPVRDSFLSPITTKGGSDIRSAFRICDMAKERLVFGVSELQ
jgi:hypothetical protein